MLTKKQLGFTLVELLTTVGIISLIVGAMAVFVIDNYRFQALTITEGASLGEAQRAVSKMKREIRGITYGENGAFPLADAEGQTLTIYTDIDFDGETERVRYWLDGTNFYKGIIEPQGGADVYPPGQENSELISGHVANDTEAIFLYYDEDFTGSEPPLVNPAEPDIHAIGIHLIVDTTPTDTDGRYVVDTIINPRNL